MTREEAIQWLTDIKENITENWSHDVAIDMAIEALSQPNYETDTEVKLAVTNRKKEKVILWDSFGSMEYVPSADAVQGEWVGLAECSVCGKQADDFIDGYVDGLEYLPNYCPNCGARMKGGDTE